MRIKKYQKNAKRGADVAMAPSPSRVALPVRTCPLATARALC